MERSSFRVLRLGIGTPRKSRRFQAAVRVGSDLEGRWAVLGKIDVALLRLAPHPRRLVVVECP